MLKPGHSQVSKWRILFKKIFLASESHKTKLYVKDLNLKEIPQCLKNPNLPNILNIFESVTGIIASSQIKILIFKLPALKYLYKVGKVSAPIGAFTLLILKIFMYQNHLKFPAWDFEISLFLKFLKLGIFRNA